MVLFTVNIEFDEENKSVRDEASVKKNGEKFLKSCIKSKDAKICAIDLTNESFIRMMIESYTGTNKDELKKALEGVSNCGAFVINSEFNKETNTGSFTHQLNNKSREDLKYSYKLFFRCSNITSLRNDIAANVEIKEQDQPIFTRLKLSIDNKGEPKKRKFEKDLFLNVRFNTQSPYIF